MKSKSKKRKGLKAKKYNLGGYVDPTDPPKNEAKASVPPGDYTLRDYDTGVDNGRPFVVIGGEKVYGEQPLQSFYNPLSPGQDFKDIFSGVMKFPKSPTEGLTDIALGALGAVPILGDAAKSLLRPVFGKTAKNLMFNHAGKGGAPLDIFSRKVMDQDVIGVYTDEARKTTKKLFDEEADRLIAHYNRESIDGLTLPPPPSPSTWIESFETATKPLTDLEIAAAKKDIKLSNVKRKGVPNSGDGYIDLEARRTGGYRNPYTVIPSDVLEERLNAVGKTDEWYLDPVLAKYFGSSWDATDAYKEVLEGSLNVPRRNILEEIHSNTSSSRAIINNKDLRNTALAFGATGAAASGVYAYANTPQAYKNAARRKLGLPQDLPSLASKEDKYVDLSNRRLGYAENVPGETPDMEANLILGGEFVEGSENSDTVKDAGSYKNVQGTIKLPSMGGEIDFNAQSGNYYGVQDGELVVGDINSFNNDTKVVPLRYSPRNISEARVENGKFRIVDQSGKPVYQNITRDGKIILYSPETGRSAFFYSSSPENSVAFTNRFLSDNNGSAIPVVIDNGRYQYYMDTKDQGTMSGADYEDYIKNDVNRPYRHGYNITAYDKGGRVKVLKKDKKGALVDLVKRYNLGGYIDPNGDPTDPKKKGAVAESTAVPNYVERAFLNYAGLMPKLQTPYFRDQGTISQTPYNDPSFLQSIYEGTPLGMTEGERLAPLDQMSLIDVMSQPLKALDFYSFDSNRGRLPTRAEWDSFGSPNPMDNALMMYNPAAQIAFASEDESGGLSAFTGIGKIGQVVRDAFNTGDDLLRITAENVSKQGKKITQRQLSQEINRTPVVDIEEAIYNPDLYGVEAPGFGHYDRARSLDQLGENSGPLGDALQRQHANEYGIMSKGFDLRRRNDFNITEGGSNLPITRNIEDLLFDRYVASDFTSGSIPQIKPLQRGGEIEKFVRKDGSLDVKGVSNYIESSKSISPADKFILGLGLSRLDPSKPAMYDEFKQITSQFIPRSLVRTSDINANYGSVRIFGDEAKSGGMMSKAVIIAEGDLPVSFETESGVELNNYMLNGMQGRHYDPVPSSPRLSHKGDERLGSHSHYRVVQFPEKEPEVSYFLEIQSDGLNPKGDSEYNRRLFEASKPRRKFKPVSTQEPEGAEHMSWEPLSWETNLIGISSRGGEIRRNGQSVVGELRSLLGGQGQITDAEILAAVKENLNLFPPVFTENELNSSYGYLNYESEKRVRSALNWMSAENANTLIKNSIEPRVIDKINREFSNTESTFTLPSYAGQDGDLFFDSSSPIEIGWNGVMQSFMDIKLFLHPESVNIEKLRRDRMKNGPNSEMFKESVKQLKNKNRLLSRQSFIEYEGLDLPFNYVGRKHNDLSVFRDRIANFDWRYDLMFKENEYLSNAQISRQEFAEIEKIKDEIKQIQKLVEDDFLLIEDIQFSLRRVKEIYDLDQTEALPLDDEVLASMINKSMDDYSPVPKDKNIYPEAFNKGYSDMISAKGYIEALKNGDTFFALSVVPQRKAITEAMNDLKDLDPLYQKYSELIEDFNSKVKIFADKHFSPNEIPEKNPVSQIMKKRPEKRIINEALHGEYNNLYNRFPTEETSRKIQGHGSNDFNDVHKKYKNLQKTLKSMGYEAKMVTDKNGNTWWEVKGTAGMLHGTAEYDAYWKGGRIGLNKKKRKGRFGAKPVKVN